MNPAVRAAEYLARRAESAGVRGVLAGKAEMAALVRDSGGRVPAWYAELLTTVPLGGLEIGWTHPDADPYDGGLLWVKVVDKWSLWRSPPMGGGAGGLTVLGLAGSGWTCGFAPGEGGDPVVRGLEPLEARLWELLHGVAVLAWDRARDEAE